MTAAPMTPADCDLRGFQYMPLDVTRLLESDLFGLSTGDEFKAAVALWARSWSQVPAASMPSDERLLAKACAVSLGEWRTLSPMALKGWQLCSDGRLYHPVVAEKALTAWLERIAFRKRSAIGHAKRYGHQFDPAPFDAATRAAFAMLQQVAPAVAAVDAHLPQAALSPASSSPEACRKDVENLPRERERDIPVGTAFAVAAPDPNQEGWTRAVALLMGAGKLKEGPARSFFGKLLKTHALEARDLLPSVVKAEGTGSPDPQGYLTAAAKAVASRRGLSATPPAPTAQEWSDDHWATAVRLFHQDGSWSAEWGPSPDQTGCRAPAHLLGSKVVRFPSGGAA